MDLLIKFLKPAFSKYQAYILKYSLSTATAPLMSLASDTFDARRNLVFLSMIKEPTRNQHDFKHSEDSTEPNI
jgi:hypothetical protein